LCRASSELKQASYGQLFRKFPILEAPAMQQFLSDAKVAIGATGRADYGLDSDRRVWFALERAAGALGWTDMSRGPLAMVIPAGCRLTIKPNLVNHDNQAPYGIEPLITHRHIIDAAFRAARLAGAAEIVVGDAPIQSCDFARMLQSAGLDDWSREAREDFPSLTGIQDFRRTVSAINHGVRHASENVLSTDQFTLFDLGTSSMLEPVTDHRGSFRVTCYNPEFLQRTHAPGRHQYLVARDVLLADVVINLPKLKMHKKAGITGALKNVVGINGNKEFLPHHRAGGSGAGGDCYPGTNNIKAMQEYVFDHQNSTTSPTAAMLWQSVNAGLSSILRLRQDRLGTEGSWSGNDTVWRMCLDLNRVLLYGRPDGSMADVPQRSVIHFVDAVIAGQGDGPLAPEPLPLGLLLLGRNAPAVDWVGALLLGYDPHKIPLTRNAFDVSPWPLADFEASDIEIAGALGNGKADDTFVSRIPVAANRYPSGWRDAVREPQHAVTG
jgi:uncharacterized protein (DUF362 family)